MLPIGSGQTSLKRLYEVQLQTVHPETRTDKHCKQNCKEPRGLQTCKQPNRQSGKTDGRALQKRKTDRHRKVRAVNNNAIRTLPRPTISKRQLVLKPHCNNAPASYDTNAQIWPIAPYLHGRDHAGYLIFSPFLSVSFFCVLFYRQNPIFIPL